MCRGAWVNIMLPQQRKYEDKSDEDENKNAINNWLNRQSIRTVIFWLNIFYIKSLLIFKMTL